MSIWISSFTPSFEPDEMACKCGNCDGLAPMDHDFMLKLQAMRDQFGPLHITSGYRCPNHKAERHKPNPGSHAQGLASDIALHGAGPRHNLIRVAFAVGMQGIGVAKTFIHVDGGHHHSSRPALWRY
jgi:uncharacterized protein YcbK (DUF882 family)